MMIITPTNFLRSLRAAAFRTLPLALCLACCVGSAHAGALTITEAYFNPDGNDTGTEWVEIQNTSGAAIDFSLTNYRLGWSRSGTETTGWVQASSVLLNAGILAPGAYAVVGPNGTANSKPRNGSPAMGNGAWRSVHLGQYQCAVQRHGLEPEHRHRSVPRIHVRRQRYADFERLLWRGLERRSRRPISKRPKTRQASCSRFPITTTRGTCRAFR